MNKASVFVITSLGKALLEKPQGRITGDARLLVGLIDGIASAAEIAEKVPPSVRVHLVEIFSRLLTYGVIAETGSEGSAPKNLEHIPEEKAPPPPAQERQGGNKSRVASNVDDVENRWRAELEKELQQVHVKLEATIIRQKAVEEDYQRMLQQVSAYAQTGQAKPEPKPAEEPQAHTGHAHAGDGLPQSLDSIKALNQALLDQQEILGNTLKLRAYQAQIQAIPQAGEHKAGDPKLTISHPQYKTLRGLDFFRGFSNEELLHFLEVAKWQEFEPGRTILNEGDIGMPFYIIVSGSVNISRKGNMLTSLETGEFFGEFAHLSGDKPVRSAGAVAATACRLLMVDPLDIEFSPVQLRLRVVEALLRGQVRRMLSSDRRIENLSKGTGSTRHEPS